MRQLPDTIKKLTLQLKKRPAVSGLFAALAVAIVGFAAIQGIRAQTFAVPGEAESGTIAGNAGKTTDTTASGGQSVKFGLPVSTTVLDAPYTAYAWVGGNSIAVVWTKPFGAVKNYEVYRDDAKVATVTPGTGTWRQDTEGRTYIDTNVKNGSSYTYKVRAVGPDGAVSAFKTIPKVTQPTTSPPMPKITIDTSKAGSDMNDYLTNVVKPYLETWYPKLEQALAYPTYTPFLNIRLYMDPTYTGVAKAAWTTGFDQPQGTLSYNPSWLRDNQVDGVGSFLHESTHILEEYGAKDTTSGWLREGIADWVRDRFTLERYQVPAPDATLAQGYSEGGGMLQWAQNTYDAGLVRKLNIKTHTDGYTDDYFKSLTKGRSPGDTYNDYKYSYYGSVGNLTGISGKCAVIAGDNGTSGVAIQLNTCSTTPKGQPWSIRYEDAGLYGTAKSRGTFINGLLGSYQCIDAKNSGTSNGTPIWSWQCNYSDAQTWRFQADGQIVNIHAGRCLSVPSDSSTDGTQLTLQDCSASAGQLWKWPK